MEIEEFGYYPFVCVLNTTKSSDIGIEKTDIITATLSHYLVAMEETKGPTLQMGGEFISDEEMLSEEAFNKAKEVEDQSRHCDECGDYLICSKDECHSLGMCVFYDIPGTNECRPCRYPMRCEEYPQPGRDGDINELSAKEECELDPCNIGNCTWDEKNKKCTSCSKTKCMQLNISLDSLTTKNRWVILSDYVAPSEYETSLTKVTDEYFGYTEANPYEIDLRGKCSDNCYSYSEGEACMPWEVCREDGESVKCCKTSVCKIIEGEHYKAELLEGDGCAYKGDPGTDTQLSDSDKCEPSQECVERVSILNLLKDAKKWKIASETGTATIFNKIHEIVTKETGTNAICCDRYKLRVSPVEDKYYYILQRVDPGSLSSMIDTMWITGSLRRKEEQSKLFFYHKNLDEEKHRYKFMMIDTNLCTYKAVSRCPLKICRDDGVWEINETYIEKEIATSSNCDDLYVLKDPCERNETCVAYNNGLAHCCAKWRNDDKDSICEGLNIGDSRAKGECRYTEIRGESKFVKVCEKGEICVISPETGEPECRAQEEGQE